MKKAALVFATSLFALLANAESFDFVAAKKAYDAGEKAGACIAIELLLDKEFASPEFNLYYGLCKAEDAKYDEAIASLERAQIQNPLFVRPKLELAMIYLKTGQKTQAKEELGELLSVKLPVEVEKNARELLKKSEERKSRLTIKPSVFKGFGFDSNANANPSQEELVNFVSAEYNLQKENIKVPKETGSIFGESGAALSAVYEIDDSRYFIGNAQVYTQNFARAKEANLNYISASAGPSVAKENFKLSSAFTIEKLWYGGANLLNAVSFNPSCAYKASDSIALNGYLKAQKKFYINSGSKDGYFKELGAGLFTQNQGHSLSVLGFVGNENKVRANDEKYIDKEHFGWRAIYNKELFSLFNLSLSCYFKQSLYKEAASFEIPSRRRDRYENYALKIDKDITKNLSISLNAAYMQNGSNYTPAKYDKSLYSFSLGYGF